MSGTVYALLVGINAYGNGADPLGGCIEDVEEFERFLLRRVDRQSLHIEKLLDEDATRQRIVDAFSSHLRRAGSDDVALFFFAGHGSSEKVDERLWFLEPTGRNQTLVCADSRRDGVPDLADKELSHLIAEVAVSGPHMLVILDCCHSGGATRDPAARTGVRVRAAPPIDLPRPLESFLPSIQEAAEGAGAAGDLIQHSVAWDSRTAITAHSPLERPRHVALLACESHELSKELPVDGRSRGAFSASLVKALEALGPTVTYRDLAGAAARHVRNLVADQSPVAYATEGDDLDQQVFGRAVEHRRSPIALEYEDEAWWIDIGSVHGVRAPRDGESTILAVFPPDPPDEAEPIAHVRAVGVQLARARVEAVDGGQLSTELRYPAVIVEVPLPSAGVELRGDGPWPAVRRGLDQSPDVREVSPEEPPGPERFVVLAENGQLTVARADGSLLTEPVAATDEGAAIVVRSLEHLARWHLIKGLGNPASTIPGQVEIEVIPAQRGESPPPRPGGRSPLRPDAWGDIPLRYHEVDGQLHQPHVFVYIHNRSNRDLFCVLLDLTDRYRCHSKLFPVERVGAGMTAVAYGGKPIPITLPAERIEAGGTVVRDWLKLIASERRFDAGSFDLPALDAAAPPPTGEGLRGQVTPSGPVGRDLVGEAGGSTTSTAPEWTTAIVSIRTERPPQSVTHP